MKKTVYWGRGNGKVCRRDGESAKGDSLEIADPHRVDMSDEIEDTLGRCHGKSETHAVKFILARANGDTSVTALEKLHAKHALPGFTDRTAEEREIERQTTDITRVSKVWDSFHLSPSYFNHNTISPKVSFPPVPLS